MLHDLRVRSISKTFLAAPVVRDVSFDVAPGEMVGVLGPSGAGKSTLLRMINRLVEPDTGEIHFGAVEVTALRGRALRLWRARAAMIFQEFNLVERLDVLTNVMIGLVAQKGLVSSLAMRFDPAERTRAIQALERFDLGPQALQRAETLSGGQKQRVAVAKALLQEPEIILADEPVASLDPYSARRVMDDLRAINREAGIGVLVTLHDLGVARAYCDRIIGLRGGTKVFDGPVAHLTDACVRELYGVEKSEQDSSPHRVQGLGEAA